MTEHRQAESVSNKTTGLPDRVTMVVLFLASLLLLSFYGPHLQPLHGDSSYLFFMGYAVSRGLSLYTDTTLGYTPLGAFAVAGSIQIAKLLHTDILITTRWIAMVTVSTASVLIFFCGKRLTGKRTTGVIAAIGLSGTAGLAILTCTNLDPKLLLSLFMIVCLLAAQFHRWFLAGAAAALAASCWQPGAVVIVASAILMVRSPQGLRLRNVAYYAAGILAGFLPMILYLTWKQEWNAFFLQAVQLKIGRPLQRIDPSTVKVWKALYPMLKSEILFALVGAGALLFYLAELLRRFPGLLRKRLIAEGPYAPLSLLTAGWIAFSGIHVQGWDDVAPFFPLVALWGAAGITRLAGLFPKRYVLAIVSALTITYLSVDSFFYSVPYTLNDEKQLVESFSKDLHPNSRVLALGAEEVYIFLDRPPYWKYLRLDRYFDDLIRITQPRGCVGLMLRLKESPPDLAVIRSLNPGPCQTRIEQKFLTHYTRSEVNVPQKRQFRYEVYTRVRASR